MNRFAVMGAALIAAAAFTGQAHAQAVVEDPGYCAQYYPNANCTNYGPGNPLYQGYYNRGYYGGPFARAEPPVIVQPHRYRHRHHK